METMRGIGRVGMTCICGCWRDLVVMGYVRTYALRLSAKNGDCGGKGTPSSCGIADWRGRLMGLLGTG